MKVSTPNSETIKFSSSLSYYIQNSYNELQRKKFSYCLAFLSCTLVVLVSTITQTVIEKAPIIFLKLAEGNAGEQDMLLYPKEGYEIPLNYPKTQFLNQTKISDLLQNDIGVLSAPRFKKLIALTAPNEKCNCLELFSQNYSGQNYILYGNAFEEKCVYLSLWLVAIDTQKEQQLQIGQRYPFGALDSDEILISEKKANYLGVQVGDIIIIEIFLGQLAQLLAERYDSEQIQSNQIGFQNTSQLIVRIPFKVKEIFKTLYGKFKPKDIEYIVIVENKHFLKHVSNFIPFSFKYKTYQHTLFVDYLRNTNLNEYSTDISINFPGPRMEFYMDSNYNNIQYQVIKLASQICQKLGIFPFDVSLPVLEELYPLRFGQIFLGVILNLILFILFVLSVLLIHSLLMVSVDTKKFEMGIVRVVGLDKNGIIQLIIIQSLTFVIPAIITGIGFSIPCLSIFSYFFEQKVATTVSIYPTVKSVIWSLSFGFLIPLLSMVYPIRQAISQTLNEQLDSSRSKTEGIHIQIEFNDKKIPWSKLQFSFISIVFGLLIYYYLPLALISSDLGLLLGIFFGILVGLLTGLLILSQNFQHIFEIIITYAFLFWQNQILRSMVLKNLKAHRKRNKKTGVMYALSLGFVIFVSVSYNMEIQRAEFQTRQSSGVYMSISATQQQQLYYQPLEEFIQLNMADYIEDYTWITTDLNNFMMQQGYENVEISNIGQIFEMKPLIVGVSPNFLKVVFPEFLDIEQQRNDNSLDIIENLYTVEGSYRAIIGEYYSKQLYLHIYDNDSFLVKVNGKYDAKIFQLQPQASLKSAPVFKFSQLQSIVTQHVIVSLPTYLRLSGLNLTGRGPNLLPMQKLLLKFKNYNDITATVVYNLFQQYQSNTAQDFQIWDYRDYKSNSEQSANAVSIIFFVLNAIVMFLCFFSLVSSMTANIFDQGKEIAVLRALGLTQTHIVLLYIDEAFVLVFSSSLIGILIGTFIGWTVTIQRVLFTQLPVKFEFPFLNLIIVLTLSLICAFGSAYFPALKIMKKEISQIFKESN